MNKDKILIDYHDDIQYESIIAENLKDIRRSSGNMIDYKQELVRLEKNAELAAGDYWKPESGQYKVRALGELEDAKPYEEEGKEPQLRKQIKLLVNQEEVLWTMPYGQTPASTYGQLVKLGSLKSGLKDKEFIVVVTGAGKSRRFTVVT